MSTTDWIMLGLVAPALLVGAWIQTYRLWRRHSDVSAGITWFTGKASAVGAQAFLLPGTAGFTLAVVGIAVDLVPDGETGGTSGGSLSLWLMWIGFLLVMLGFWMWLFAWPQFLVPPHLRGRPGWIVASWRDGRDHRRERKLSREQGRQGGGKRATR